jgi:hypothetical protein
LTIIAITNSSVLPDKAIGKNDVSWAPFFAFDAVPTVISRTVLDVCGTGRKFNVFFAATAGPVSPNLAHYRKIMSGE